MRMVRKDTSSDLTETIASFDEIVVRNVLLLYVGNLCF